LNRATWNCFAGAWRSRALAARRRRARRACPQRSSPWALTPRHASARQSMRRSRNRHATAQLAQSARRESTPRRPTSGRAAVPRPASSPYAHRAAPELLLAVAPRTAFAPYRDPSPKAQAPTKGTELAGGAHYALAEPLPPRHGCPTRQAPGSAPFPNCAATQASSLGPVDELAVVCCLGDMTMPTPTASPTTFPISTGPITRS
jgi:hypothetical protein